MLMVIGTYVVLMEIMLKRTGSDLKDTLNHSISKINAQTDSVFSA